MPVAALVAAALVTVVASPTLAVPILEPADAEELVATLREATEEQDLCYGWVVEVDDQESGTTSADVGSSLGVGQRASGGLCDRYLELRASVTYTSEASESEDTASLDIRSNVSPAPTADDLRRLGVSEAGLLGEADDDVLADAVNALPLLAVEAGLAPPLALEADETPLQPGEAPTGSPGADWVRANGGSLAFLTVLLLGGLGWLAYLGSTRRRPRSAANPPQVSRPE